MNEKNRKQQILDKINSLVPKTNPLIAGLANDYVSGITLNQLRESSDAMNEIAALEMQLRQYR